MAPRRSFLPPLYVCAFSAAHHRCAHRRRFENVQAAEFASEVHTATGIAPAHQIVLGSTAAAAATETYQWEPFTFPSEPTGGAADPSWHVVAFSRSQLSGGTTEVPPLQPQHVQPPPPAAPAGAPIPAIDGHACEAEFAEALALRQHLTNVRALAACEADAGEERLQSLRLASAQHGRLGAALSAATEQTVRRCVQLAGEMQAEVAASRAVQEAAASVLCEAPLWWQRVAGCRLLPQHRHIVPLPPPVAGGAPLARPSLADTLPPGHYDALLALLSSATARLSAQLTEAGPRWLLPLRSQTEAFQAEFNGGALARQAQSATFLTVVADAAALVAEQRRARGVVEAACDELEDALAGASAGTSHADGDAAWRRLRACIAVSASAAASPCSRGAVAAAAAALQAADGRLAALQARAHSQLAARVAAVSAHLSRAVTPLQSAAAAGSAALLQELHAAAAAARAAAGELQHLRLLPAAYAALVAEGGRRQAHEAAMRQAARAAEALLAGLADSERRARRAFLLRHGPHLPRALLRGTRARDMPPPLLRVCAPAPPPATVEDTCTRAGAHLMIAHSCWQPAFVDQAAAAPWSAEAGADNDSPRALESLAALQATLRRIQQWNTYSVGVPVASASAASEANCSGHPGVTGKQRSKSLGTEPRQQLQGSHHTLPHAAATLQPAASGGGSSSGPPPPPPPPPPPAATAAAVCSSACCGGALETATLQAELASVLSVAAVPGWVAARYRDTHHVAAALSSTGPSAPGGGEDEDAEDVDVLVESVLAALGQQTTAATDAPRSSPAGPGESRGCCDAALSRAIGALDATIAAVQHGAVMAAVQHGAGGAAVGDGGCGDGDGEASHLLPSHVPDRSSTAAEEEDTAAASGGGGGGGVVRSRLEPALQRRLRALQRAVAQRSGRCAHTHAAFRDFREGDNMLFFPQGARSKDSRGRPRYAALHAGVPGSYVLHLPDADAPTKDSLHPPVPPPDFIIGRCVRIVAVTEAAGARGAAEASATVGGRTTQLVTVAQLYPPGQYS